MKKGKATLLALSVGVLTSLAFLGFDIKNPEKTAAVTTPYEVVNEATAPVAPTPRRALVRKDVKSRKLKTALPVGITAAATDSAGNAAATESAGNAAATESAGNAAASPESAEPTAASDSADAKKEAVNVPMPRPWDGSFVKHDRPYPKDECDIDRPCSPRGRDGVLLVGVSFSLNGYQPMTPEILSVGSYQQRTPLLVYQ